MKKKATTITAASCSRPARPRKALGACAQSKRAATVSPGGSEDLGILESLMQAMQAVIVAKYPPLTNEATEFAIRAHLLGIGKS